MEIKQFEDKNLTHFSKMKKYILNMKMYIILVGTIMSSFLAYSQDTLVISKNELNQKVLEKNLQLKISEKNFQSSKADYEQTKSLFLPNINISYTGISTNNPLMAFGSKLNQAILKQSDFNPDELNKPQNTQNFATVIEIQQPLINMDGVYGRQAANAKMESYQFQTARTKEYLELEVSKAFMQLQLAYYAIKVIEKAAITTKANLKLVEDYYEKGLLLKPDLLNVQIRISEIANQLQYAKSNIQNSSDYLAFLLDEDVKGKVYKPLEELENTISTERFNQEVSENRKDILAMYKSIEAQRKLFLSSKMNFVPRLNIFGNYQMYDKNIFGVSGNGYLVGFQMHWNVFDGSKSIGKINQTKVNYHKAELELKQYKNQSQLELNKANRQLYDAENKVSLSKLAFNQAEEAFRIRENRFAQGQEKTTDLLIAETQMAQKELEYLQSIFEYNLTKEFIQFLTK